MGEDRVLLEGMVFFGRHGVLPAERELGQRFVVSVAMHLDLSDAASSDDPVDTADYGRVYELVRGIVEGAPANLIETVAGRVAGEILERHPRVEAVRVKIAKPEAPLTGVVTPAVEVLRRRG
jgi:dihydroneopterin aldolase